MPVPAAVEYARLYTLNPTEAVKHLAGAISDKWYFTEIARELADGGTAKTAVLITILAKAAGVGAEREAQLQMILEWLLYVRLIKQSPEEPSP